MPRRPLIRQTADFGRAVFFAQNCLFIAARYPACYTCTRSDCRRERARALANYVLEELDVRAIRVDQWRTNTEGAGGCAAVRSWGSLRRWSIRGHSSIQQPRL